MNSMFFYILGVLLSLFGVYKLDLVLIEGLNYFGKYVFFGLFHLVILYSFYYSYKTKRLFVPLIEGIGILGVCFGLGLFD